MSRVPLLFAIAGAAGLMMTGPGSAADLGAYPSCIGCAAPVVAPAPVIVAPPVAVAPSCGGCGAALPTVVYGAPAVTYVAPQPGYVVNQGPVYTYGPPAYAVPTDEIPDVYPYVGPSYYGYYGYGYRPYGYGGYRPLGYRGYRPLGARFAAVPRVWGPRYRRGAMVHPRVMMAPRRPMIMRGPVAPRGGVAMPRPHPKR